MGEEFYGYEEGFNFGDFMFSAFPIMFFIVFALILGTFVFVIGKNISQWNKNNNQPRLTANAMVVTKRTAVRGGGETSASTDYFVTFEFSSGDRSEFEVKGEDFGQLVEGDSGELQFQGTRYLGFIRERAQE